MVSLAQQIKGLQQDIDDIIAGYYTPPTALGPNTLSKNSVKAKTIRSGNIDVTNLESVQTKTGSLTVDGNLTIGTGGSLRSGKTSYADTSNAGFWMGIDSSVAVIRIGNIGHTSGMVWDGTTLAITGTVTATSGTIGGWTISSTDLSADSGAIGMASSGSVRFWSGHTTPSSAPFQVSSAGALTATSGSVGGWTIDSSGIRLGSGATARGIDTGSTAFYAGSATPSSAPFKVTTAGVLTATGATIGGTITSSAITASSLSITGTASFSGGSMTLPNGGSITSSTVDLNQGTLDGMTIDGTLTVSTSGKIQSGKTTYGSGTGWLLEYNSGTPRLDIGSSSAYLRWSGSALTMKGRLEFGTGSYIESDAIVIDASASTSLTFKNSTTSYLEMGALAATAYIQTANNADLFIGSVGGFVSIGASESVAINMGDTGGTYSVLLRDSAGINQWSVNSDGLVNFATAPSSSPGNTAWTSRGFSADAGGYFKVQIGGTTYRIPTYADS